jgi:glycosyltransferase involved in cell wall biosynthesis
MTKTGNVLSAPIAYLTGEYPRATDTFIQREVFALRTLGIDVVTCSIRKTGSEHLVGPEQKAESKSTFYVLAAAKAPFRLLSCHLKALVKSPRKYFCTLGFAFRTGSPGFKGRLFQLFYFAEAVILADHLKSKGVIHLHNHIATASCSVAMLASKISDIPYSFTLHGPDIFFEPQRWRLDAKIKTAKFVACISDFCRSQAMSFSNPQDWGKLHIVHCGVEPERYTDETGVERNTPHLTFIGRLASVKGVPVLFDALKILKASYPDLCLTLIGDGPEREELEDYVRSNDLVDMVEFAGYKSQSEVALALQETDVFVLPSFAEGVPVVLMEAMAAKVPVVATRIAGIPELIEDGVHGRLVPAGDVDSLASAISDLIGDAKLRKKMGDAARDKVIAEYNIKHEAAWLAQIFYAYNLDLEQPAKRPEKVINNG